MQSTGHTHPGKGGGVGPTPSQGQLECRRRAREGPSPQAPKPFGEKGALLGRGIAPLVGAGGGIPTRNSLRLVSKVRLQSRTMWFGTGDLAPRPKLPLLGCSFARFPPPSRVLDIERRKSESLSLFQKLNFSGEGRVLSPGWRPLPRPRRRAESPGRPSLSLSPLGHPRIHWAPSPPQSGPLASHRGQRDVQGAAATTSRPAPKPSWAGPRPAFIFGGRAPGTDGSKDQSGWGPPAARPRPSPGLGRWSHK